MSAKSRQPQTQGGPLRPWRVLVGALLHFGIVGYLLVVPLLCLFLAPAHASAEAIARLVLKISFFFLAGLCATALGAVPVALLIDRPARRRRNRANGSPAARSAAAVEGAAQMALDEPLASTVARIAAAAWDYQDPVFQALARDLHEVVHATTAALASASPERRGAIIDRAAQALARLESELDRLATTRAHADEQRVEILSTYVDARYPARDFP